MSEYFAFLQPLLADPADETTRLAYTDWLAERGDPRAEYLAAEAQWIALQPSDAEYRSLYRRVSELAAAQDPTWFCWAGRITQLVRRAWEPLGVTFRAAPAPDPAALPREWARASGQLVGALLPYFGGDETRRRFCPPVDLVAFLCTIGRRSDGWIWFLGSHDISSGLASSLGEYPPGRPPDGLSAEEPAARPAHPEVWLQFGGWSNKHSFFVCCDLDSPHFGVIGESPGGHPWLFGAEHLRFDGRNLLHFLTGYLPSRRGGPDWPRVPYREWATY